MACHYSFTASSLQSWIKSASRVLPSNSSSITTQLISDERAASVLSSDWAICDHRTALDYFRLSADNRLLFSGLSNDTGLEPRDLINTVRKKMDKGYPQLQRINIDDGWSGQMGNGLNRMAQLDRRANTVFTSKLTQVTV